MKKRFLTVMLALLGSLAQAAETSSNPLTRPEGAMDRRFGAGLILGEPIGASFKYWLDEQIALDGAVAWSFRHDCYPNLRGIQNG